MKHAYLIILCAFFITGCGINERTDNDTNTLHTHYENEHFKLEFSELDVVRDGFYINIDITEKNKGITYRYEGIDHILDQSKLQYKVTDSKLFLRDPTETNQLSHRHFFETPILASSHFLTFTYDLYLKYFHGKVNFTITPEEETFQNDYFVIEKFKRNATQLSFEFSGQQKMRLSAADFSFAINMNNEEIFPMLTNTVATPQGEALFVTLQFSTEIPANFTLEVNQLRPTYMLWEVPFTISIGNND